MISDDARVVGSGEFYLVALLWGFVVTVALLLFVQFFVVGGVLFV